MSDCGRKYTSFTAIEIGDRHAGKTIHLLSGASMTAVQIVAELTYEPPLNSLYFCTNGATFQHATAGTAAGNWTAVAMDQGAFVASVSAANVIGAVGANPTQAEYATMVTLANATKAQLNALLTSLITAGTIAAS